MAPDPVVSLPGKNNTFEEDYLFALTNAELIKARMVVIRSSGEKTQRKLASSGRRRWKGNDILAPLFTSIAVFYGFVHLSLFYVAPLEK